MNKKDFIDKFFKQDYDQTNECFTINDEIIFGTKSHTYTGVTWEQAADECISKLNQFTNNTWGWICESNDIIMKDWIAFASRNKLFEYESEQDYMKDDDMLANKSLNIVNHTRHFMFYEINGDDVNDLTKEANKLLANRFGHKRNSWKGGKGKLD